MDTLRRIRQSLFEFEEFLILEKDDKKIISPLKYVLTITFLGALIMFFVRRIHYVFMGHDEISVINNLASSLGASPTTFLILTSATFFFGFSAAAILLSLPVHITVKFLGGKRGYVNSFKGLIYGLAPVYVLRAIPYVNVISYIWAFSLQIRAFSRFQGIGWKNSTIALFFSEIIPVSVILYLLSFFMMF
jgi:hypothetical protein